MTRPTIFLFDIDDTLLTNAGAGRRALQAACCELLGERDWFPFTLAGMTDRSIVRRALCSMGAGAPRASFPRPSAGGGGPAIPPEEMDIEAIIDRVLGRYLERLVDEVARAEGYAVFPGVVRILDELARAPRCAVGLGTGNLERGARIKLARVGLDGRFAFGGFGSDHEVRAEILRAGARRGALHLGEPLERCRVVAVGDTPRDVEAALAIGAECVGVGTGAHSPDELRAAGAVAAFPDLAADGALAALLGE